MKPGIRLPRTSTLLPVKRLRDHGKKLPSPSPPKGLWVEGATALKVGKYWYVYFDAYRKDRYGVMRTKDFKSWEDVSGRLKVPKGMRHGTVLSTSHDILDELLKQE
jgi:hypothetical protein